MDAHRFDRLSRFFAGPRVTRRRALQGGGAVIAVGALSAAGPLAASAQTATPDATPACPAAGSPGATPASGSITFLYVQVVEGGAFQSAGESDLYDLELRHAGGTTLAFADRPARTVRLLPSDEALANLGFTPVPPNAALITGPADAEVTVVVELLEGRYDGAAGTLTYRVRGTG